MAGNNKLTLLADVSACDMFSYSKLTSLEQCPMAHYMRYREKATGDQNGFAQCGTLVHEALEKYFKGELLQCELEEFFMDNFEEFVPNGVRLKFPSGYSIDLSESYQKQISEFLVDFDGFEIEGKKLIPLEAEKSFKLLVSFGEKQAILQGVIDLIAEDADKNLYVIDHKSKKEFKTQEERDKYARQLYLYAAYVKFHYGKYPIKLVFDMFRTPYLEVIDFSENEMNRTMDWVREAIEAIENEDLFLPVDFSRELEAFEDAKNKMDRAPYDYTLEPNNCKYKLWEAQKALEDKMFYCINLCDYRNSCDVCADVQQKYNEILKGEGDGKI